MAPNYKLPTYPSWISDAHARITGDVAGNNIDDLSTTAGWAKALQDTYAMHDQTTRRYVPKQAPSLYEMVAMRMGWIGAVRDGFDFVVCHRGTDKVFVFLVSENQAVTIEDDGNLFPSDKLVTQLRLLKTA